MKKAKGDILKLCPEIELLNIEALTLIEIIEHVYLNELQYLEENIFGHIRPKLVVVTTPNYDFNYFFDPNNKK